MGDFKNAYTLKKEFREQRQSLTLKFNTKCSVKEIRKAVRVGLIRVGSKLGGFETHPSHKSLLTCPDVIHVGDFKEENDFISAEEDTEEYNANNEIYEEDEEDEDEEDNY